MNELSNNIFSFATKELSQDAVICWLLNWIKYPESELYNLAIDMFDLLGVKDIEKNQDISIKQQVNKADIVVTLHGQKQILIIEDKVYSTEHGNQIEEYRKFFDDLNNQRDYLDNKSNDLYSIKTVYFKTGFFYDEDKVVVADVIVDSKLFYRIISKEKYHNKSEILDSFVVHLKEVMSYYEKYGDYTYRPDKNAKFYISTEYIAQHNLMRFIFPEELWNKNIEVFMVKNGSSSGRPWTETSICESIKHKEAQETYSFFWRIDTNVNGPYLSLRLYDIYDKKKPETQKRHIDIYERSIDICKAIFDKNKNQLSLKWEEVKEGYRGNYVEASLLSIKLEKYLLNWNDKGESLKADVNLITKEFIDEISNE